MPDDVGVTDAALDAAREAGRQEVLDRLAKLCEAFGATACRQAIRGLIPEGMLPMEAAADLPDHEDVRGILGDPPHATPAQALGGAAFALEMCEATMDAETAFSGALAKAAVIAYLSLTGRDAEAKKVSHVDV